MSFRLQSTGLECPLPLETSVRKLLRHAATGSNPVSTVRLIGDWKVRCFSVLLTEAMVSHAQRLNHSIQKKLADPNDLHR